jgi:DNA replication and repair protein RecF
MYLKAFSHQGVRNLTPGKIELTSGLNVFFGDNGAGKSSILEAISYLTSGRSFRTNKLDLVVNESLFDFVVFGLTEDQKRLGVSYDKKTKTRQIKLNGEKLKRLSELSSLYPTQILSPESYHLIDSGPSERRKYLDWCLFHVEHNYHSVWKEFSLVLKQRNSLLRQAKFKNIKQELYTWDQQFCSLALRLNQYRSNLLNQLELILKQTVQQLDVSFCDDLKLSYYQGNTDDLRDKLEASYESDIKSGTTKFGPHKSDLRIKINGYLAKDYLSRGQKKVLINAMYLAQTLLLKSITDKASIFVIDDFTSELDTDNQKALLNMLLSQDKVQILLSCLQQDSLKWLEKGYNNAHMFHVEQGTIRPIVQ